jgi:tetratricopeptide (TPR) repeat protein
VRILCNDISWLGPAMAELRAQHDVVLLDRDAIRGTWETPDEGWWRRVVPDGWVPDVALFATPEYLPVPPLLSALPCPVVLWVGDWYANWQGVSWISDQVELVLADATGAAALRLAGFTDVAECCPWTWDPALHRPDWDAEPARDVGFIGNLNEALQVRRNRWLGRLARLPADVDLRIDTGIFGDDYVRWTQRSRITFNFSLTGDVNMRCFEAPACGSMTILNAEAAEQAARWFELGRELVIYDETNLEDVIAHYLRHDDERRAIARAGWERVQQHGPRERLQTLIGHLERVAGQGRRRVAALSGPRNSARQAGQSATLALSVADTEALAGYEVALDRAERNDPRDAGIQLAYAVLYCTLAGSGHPQGPAALVWAGEALERAARHDPTDAVVALARAQLLHALGDLEIAHALARRLVVDILARRMVARPERLPLIDTIAWRAARQEALLAQDDPEPELTRLVLVETLKLAADVCATPEERADHRAAATAAAGGDPATRLRLAIALLACDPPAALPHTEIVVRELPINAAGWNAHARALAAGGRLDEAARFVADRLELARRVHVPEPMLEQLRRSVPQLV